MDRSENPVNEPVSSYQHEGMQALLGLVIKRLIVSIVVAICLLVALAAYSYYTLSNATKSVLEAHKETLEFLSEYEFSGDESTSVTQDGKGINFFNGGDLTWARK